MRARRRAQLGALKGSVAVVVGGTRGLGLAIARELAAAGCRVAICGRDDETLDRAREDLIARGGDVLAAPCDATDEVEVARFVELVLGNFGRIDVLVTVAATIRVGPIETTSARDFHDAMESIFWSAAYTSLAVLPVMRRQGGGRIAHVTSIGGRIALPHLVPYSAAKFAEVGLSEGLRVEVAKDGISVTTIVPWLMRTGSHLHARFAGRSEAEYGWFGTSESSWTAMDPDRAARRIVRAIVRREAHVVIGWPAKLAVRVHALWPSMTLRLISLVDRALPRAPDDELGRHDDHEGVELADKGATAPVRAVERMTRAQAQHYNQR